MADRPGRLNSKIKLACTLFKSSVHNHSYVEGSLGLAKAWNFVNKQLTQICPLTWSIWYDTASRIVLHFSITHYKVSSLYSSSSLTTYSYVHMSPLWSESVKKKLISCNKDDSLKFRKTKNKLVQEVLLSQRELKILLMF